MTIDGPAEEESQYSVRFAQQRQFSEFCLCQINIFVSPCYCQYIPYKIINYSDKAISCTSAFDQITWSSSEVRD